MELGEVTHGIEANETMQGCGSPVRFAFGDHGPSGVLTSAKIRTSGYRRAHFSLISVSTDVGLGLLWTIHRLVLQAAAPSTFPPVMPHHCSFRAPIHGVLGTLAYVALLDPLASFHSSFPFGSLVLAFSFTFSFASLGAILSEVWPTALKTTSLWGCFTSFRGLSLSFGVVCNWRECIDQAPWGAH